MDQDEKDTQKNFFFILVPSLLDWSAASAQAEAQASAMFKAVKFRDLIDQVMIICYAKIISCVKNNFLREKYFPMYHRPANLPRRALLGGSARKRVANPELGPREVHLLLLDRRQAPIAPREREKEKEKERERERER